MITDATTRPKPYYHDETHGITIYHGDCREILPALGEFDMCVTDPPYGVGYKGGHFHSGNVNIVREREPLANDDRDVYEWLIPYLCKAVDGPCYVFFAGSKAVGLYKALEECKCDIHAMIIWHKTNATYAAMNSQYKQRHEPCLYFKPPGTKTRWCGPSTESTVWELRREKENVHPTQKPVWLVQRAMSNHDYETILDPFMGSGTTLVAAKLEGKQAVGIELEERYCEIAANRLAQGVLF